MPLLSRREFLAASTSWPLAAAFAVSGARAAPPPLPRFGAAAPFSFELLRQRAQALAAEPYVPERPPAPKLVAGIDFDVGQKIRFRPERALWSAGPGPYPVRLFHLDKFNTYPVRINLLGDGMAREVVYSPQDFDYADTGLETRLPADLGFSGFRVMDGRGKETDWLAFRGASYFRTSGEEAQYGASARGIAVDTGLDVPEEFPRFTEFWLSEPADGAASVTIYALLNGPSLAGAYRITASHDRGALMEIAAELFIRAPIRRLGVAPLTSMYWYGENERRYAVDWRPEIHDNDGLALATGSGERIWRPLIDPTSVRTNSFFDTNPRGFGLLQRDRDFAHYQDDGAFYNRRPSIWVEPVGDWGEGAVQLVEIPTRDEIHDNIVAYWLPKRPVLAGDRLNYAYRLYWQNDEPHPPENIGRVTATRIGIGGVPGVPKPEDARKRKFVIDFAGGPLAAMAPRFDVEPVIDVSSGTVDNAYVIKVVGTERWRALFDLELAGDAPVDLRCFLRLGERTLTETWLYQYLPDR